MKMMRSAAVWGALLIICAVIVWFSMEAAAITIAVLVAALAVWMAATRPRAFLLIAVLATLVAPTIEHLSGVEVIGYVDEAAAGAVVVTALLHRLSARKVLSYMPGTWFFVIWLAAGVVSSIQHDVEPGFAATSAFLFIKGPLFAFAFLQFDWTKEHLQRAVKAATATVLVVMGFALVNLAIPAVWTTMLSTQGRVDVRYGIASLVGPFTHPFAFGEFMSLAFIATFLYRTAVKKSAWNAVLLIATGLGTLLSGRRKALAAMVGGALVGRLYAPGRRAAWVIGLVLLGPLVLLVAADQITLIVTDIGVQYLDQAYTAARTIMYRDSVGILVRDFPFGAGFGRYGSFGALSEYSPEYIARGYHLIYGMRPENPLYMTDTFWPAIIGEAGFLGFVGYAGMLACLAVSAAKARRSDEPLTKWVGLVAIGWSVEYAIESIAAPVYSGPPLFALLFAVLGIAISRQRADGAADRFPRPTRKLERLPR